MKQYKLMTAQEIANFQIKLNETQIVGIDIESTGLNFLSDTILLIQIKVKDIVYIINTKYMQDRIIKYILDLINCSNKKVVGHNIKFDLKFLYKKYGILITNVSDLMLQETIITNGLGDKYHSLKELVKKYKNIELDKDVRNTFVNFNGTVTEEQYLYSAMDVEYLEDIYDQQCVLIKDSNQDRVKELEDKLIPVIVSMEVDGIGIDREGWAELAASKLVQISASEISLKEEIIQEFANVYKTAIEIAECICIPVKTSKLREYLSASPEGDVRRWLIDNLKLSSPKQLLSIYKFFGIELESADKKTLASLSAKIKAGNVECIDITDKILVYKDLFKKAHAFGEKFLEFVSPVTGRIHTEFSQIGSASGRMTSSKPNLLQIPSDMDYRSKFKPTPGYIFIDIDFSQEELRLIGSISKEKNFIHAYNNNIDIHTMTASLVNKVPIEEVTKEQRRNGKTLNFAMAYGSSEYGLSYNFGFTLDDARKYLKGFEEGYPTLAAFQKILGELILKKGYSCTLLGRRRYFERKVMFTDSREREKYIASVQRELRNHIIQGTGAEILKESLVDIFYNSPFKYGEDFRILLAVHDEILFEARKEIAEEVREYCKNTMQSVEQKYLNGIPALAEAGELSEVWGH